MATLVVEGAVLQCSFGVAPGELNVLPEQRVLANKLPAAVVTDFIPMENIMPFGMCTSLANPEVAAATAAAEGVLTPMPCIPCTVTPWVPGSPTCLLGKIPALTNSSMCTCAWGGEITISVPGQMTVGVK